MDYWLLAVYPLVTPPAILIYRPTQTTAIQAGKFLLDYSIYFQDHTIATRQEIGFDEGNEIYNLEYSYQAENWSRSISTNFGRPDDASLLAEKAISAKSGLSFYDHDKVNMSLYAKTQNGNHRQLTTPYILLGFTPSIYFVGEMDFQFFQPTKEKATQKIFDYAKLDYEPIQGLRLYWRTQSLINDFKRNYQPLPQDLKYGMITNRLYGLGPGIYWYPRPHFYIQLEIQQQFSAELPSSQTSGFLTGNIYL